MGGAVAVILIKERHIIDAFQRAGATSPERAVLPSDINVHDGRVAWRRLRSHAVLRESHEGSGLFWLEVETWKAVHRTRRRAAFALLLAIVAFAVLSGVFVSSP
jgi:hypothetical protein